MYRLFSSYRSSATIIEGSSKELLDYIYSGTEFNLELSVKETLLYGTTISVRRLCDYYPKYALYLRTYLKESKYSYIHYVRDMDITQPALHLPRQESIRIVTALEKSGVTNVLIYSMCSEWWKVISIEHWSKLRLNDSDFIVFFRNSLHSIRINLPRNWTRSDVTNIVLSFVSVMHGDNLESSLLEGYLNNYEELLNIMYLDALASNLVQDIKSLWGHVTGTTWTRTISI